MDGNAQNDNDVTIMDLLDEGKVPNLHHNYYKKWYYKLGEWLNKNNHVTISKDDLDSLEKYFNGGGSCTIALFDAMCAQTTNDLVKELREFARKHRREDVLEILNTAEIPDEQKISCMDETIKFQLACKLDRHIVGVEGWETLATHLKFKDEQRQAFQNVQVQPGRFSPTKALFEIIRQQKKNLRLDFIIEWAKEVGRNDVADNLISFKEKVLLDRGQSFKSPVQSDSSGQDDVVNVQAKVLFVRNEGFATQIIQDTPTDEIGDDQQDGGTNDDEEVDLC